MRSEGLRIVRAGAVAALAAMAATCGLALAAKPQAAKPRATKPPAAAAPAAPAEPFDTQLEREWQRQLLHAAGGATNAKAAPGSVARDRYVAAVEKALAGGRMLAAKLRGQGVDTAAFEASGGRIAKALAALDTASEDLKTHALYLDARRAVRELALSNPLLDFEKILLVRRGERNLALPANWQSNSSLGRAGYDNDLAVMTGWRDGGKFATLCRPEGGRFIGDVDLHFDGSRLLFSSTDANGVWGVFEMPVSAGQPRKLPLIGDRDVENYDACYLPDGNIMFTSTAPMIGVPCVRGSSKVTNLYLLETRSGNIRRLTFDQDHDWCPTVLPDGHVMYLRWEYSGLPHSNSRILFQMNPDGTGQMALYGSNSFWPNGVFYARPVPGHPTKIAGIVTGHHGVARMGELLIFDPAVGHQEADGAVQRIGDYGKKVEPVVRDQLVNSSWPKFLHPWPLSEDFLLTSCKPTPSSPWGLYLVDTFDNFVLLAAEPGKAMLEPIPLKAAPLPPMIASKVDASRKDSLVYLADIYQGGGLRNIPRGEVKKLRLMAYSFSYHGVGGLLGVVGADGPWDVERVLGTVPVEPDGSALFRVPANTPISIQPLDESGKTMQVMRSWFVGMPGEIVSCVGCHERSRDAASLKNALAPRRGPSDIQPWRGPTRGFAFAREVQPVLDRYCAGCHRPEAGERFRPDAMPDLRGIPVKGWASSSPGNGGADSGHFSVAYAELACYVRRPGIESDIHMLTPMEFHADTTELVQMLSKGHHGVKLDQEAWDRLVTWIDLNAPYHGTWTEAVGQKRTAQQALRRRELMLRYAGLEEDEEAAAPAPDAVEPIIPPPAPAVADRRPECPGWPMTTDEARRRQGEPGQTTLKVQVADGVALELVRVPAGDFLMGDPNGPDDARPLCRARIDKPFWMGKLEITNAQFACFDPLHDSRIEPKHSYQFGVTGYQANGPNQPVVRVSWRQAMDFCQWLTRQSGGKLRFTLPTEAQWEWACRAGTDTPMSFGDLAADFSKFANFADVKLAEFASNPYTVTQPMKNATRWDDWIPRDTRFNDQALISAEVGKYLPNAWGLHDMHGNVWEWTRSAYRPYPYAADDGRDEPAAEGTKVVRGGSWYDRPKRCTSAFRLSYRPYQPVFNVGFRVAAEGEALPVAAAKP
jgi:formylglycine-generating enzyme required for sulfatase activity